LGVLLTTGPSAAALPDLFELLDALLAELLDALLPQVLLLVPGRNLVARDVHARFLSRFDFVSGTQRVTLRVAELLELPLLRLLFLSGLQQACNRRKHTNENDEPEGAC
jgi:hypothetical protein